MPSKTNDRFNPRNFFKPTAVEATVSTQTGGSATNSVFATIKRAYRLNEQGEEVEVKVDSLNLRVN